MNLRRQLLLVSLLLLSLPWAGCQFIREMEGALRQGQEQSLQASAQAVAAVIAEQPALLFPNPARRQASPGNELSIYAFASDQPLILDGYADGWNDIPEHRFSHEDTSTPLAVSYQAVTRKGFLYLLLRIEDSRVDYHNPGLSSQYNGDRLVLRTWQNDERQDYVIATAAPGSVRARPASRRYRGADAERIRGYWQDAAGGYSLELEMPLAHTGGRLGFFLIDTGSGAGSRTLGNIRPEDDQPPPWLIYSPEALRETLRPFSLPGTRIEVVDSQNWLLASISSQDSPPEDTANTFWLLQVIYRSILSNDRLELPPPAPAPGRATGPEISTALSGLSANHRYRDPLYNNRTRLSAAAPVADDLGVMGAVVLRQSGEEYLSLTDQAFSQLLGYSLLAVGVGALGLLGFATVLSWRIGKLNRATRHAMTDQGLLRDSFPRSRARDEIGELSRSYAELLDQLQEYNDYLRTLSRKLSHELRTPVAVIQSSLDNLEEIEGAPGDSAIYLERAREGLFRLNRILTAMSEANRLEESIRNNELRDTDLAALLGEMLEAYRPVYPEHPLRARLPASQALIRGVPELIVQALDKLVDNAASFSAPGSTIELALSRDGEYWVLSVSNPGAVLPDELREHLFDPMVSLRGDDADGVHLGLGLHIVRLISDFHAGSARADNLADNSGVRVSMAFPALPTPEPDREEPATRVS